MDDCILKSAVISPCKRYRWRLSRWWGNGPRVAWLMMNPSTANALDDDATIRKCMGFAKRWGFDGIEVANLSAWRDRHPNALLSVDDLVGSEYEFHLLDAMAKCSTVIAAWGCESTLRKSYVMRVNSLATPRFIKKHYPNIAFECLGKSKLGTPYHPLMLAYTTPRLPFDVKELQ